MLEPPGPIDPKLPHLAADPPNRGRYRRISAAAMRYRCGNTPHPRIIAADQSKFVLQLAEARLQAEPPTFQWERVGIVHGSRSEGRHGPEILLSLDAGIGAGLGCVKGWPSFSELDTALREVVLSASLSSGPHEETLPR